MIDGKNNMIAALLQKYDIQDALKNLLGGTIQEMLEAEMDGHLGYEPYERTDSTNARNGKKQKMIRIKYGEAVIDVPQDRASSFVPKVVKKRQKDI